MPLDPWPTETAQSDARYDAAVAEFERDMIRRVSEEMRGQDDHLVHAVLVERLRGRLPGVELDDITLRKIAKLISNGQAHAWAGNGS